MSRQAQRLALAGAAAVVLVAAALGAWALLRGPGKPEATLVEEPIAIHTSFTPLEPEFADTVTALVDVYVDTQRIDPGSVRLHQRVPPYVIVGRTRTERTVGRVAVLHYATRIECIDIGCAPLTNLQEFTFPPLTVSYDERGVATTAEMAWPQLTVHSRLTERLRDHPALRLTQLGSAAPQFRVAPRRAGIALFVVAGLLGLAGAALLLALVAAPLRARRRGPSPLERILLELEASGSNGDSGRRRSALEQLARELGPVDPELSRESRVLAWAPSDPPPDAIEELTRRAREQVAG